MKLNQILSDVINSYDEIKQTYLNAKDLLLLSQDLSKSAKEMFDDSLLVNKAVQDDFKKYKDLSFDEKLLDFQKDYENYLFLQTKSQDTIKKCEELLESCALKEIKLKDLAQKVLSVENKEIEIKTELESFKNEKTSLLTYFETSNELAKNVLEKENIFKSILEQATSSTKNINDLKDEVLNMLLGAKDELESLNSLNEDFLGGILENEALKKQIQTTIDMTNELKIILDNKNLDELLKEIENSQDTLLQILQTKDEILNTQKELDEKIIKQNEVLNNFYTKEYLDDCFLKLNENSSNIKEQNEQNKEQIKQMQEQLENKADFLEIDEFKLLTLSNTNEIFKIFNKIMKG